MNPIQVTDKLKNKYIDEGILKKVQGNQFNKVLNEFIQFICM